MSSKIRTIPIDKEQDDDVRWVLKLFVFKLLHPERFYSLDIFNPKSAKIIL